MGTFARNGLKFVDTLIVTTQLVIIWSLPTKFLIDFCATVTVIVRSKNVQKSSLFQRRVEILCRVRGHAKNTEGLTSVK